MILDEPPSAAAPAPASASQEARLYVPEYQRWTVRIMTGVEKEYCYQKAPGDEFHHLIVPGEIFVTGGAEKLCLTCALQRGVVSTNRLFWQVRGP